MIAKNIIMVKHCKNSIVNKCEIGLNSESLVLSLKALKYKDIYKDLSHSIKKRQNAHFNYTKYAIFHQIFTSSEGHKILYFIIYIIYMTN